jgi:type IV pilus assembly protein PilQ
MRAVWTIAAAGSIAAAALGAPAPVVAAVAESAPADAARAALGRLAGSVTSLSVVPGSGAAEVVVGVDGAVEVSDFNLANPHRVVIDLIGARVGKGRKAYDKVARGAIANLRVSQYKADVVRIVLDLDGPRRYTVTRGEGDVRIAVDGPASFAAWSSGGDAAPASKPVALAAGAVMDLPDASDVQAAPAEPLPVSAPAAEPAEEAEEAEEPMVKPVAQQRRAPAARPAARRAAPRPQPRITVTYQDADIRDVVAAFAAFSGRTLVAGRDVSGTVTAEIRDQPWDVALRSILSAHGMAATEEASGIIAVDSYENILKKQASEPLVTQIVPINYGNATSLVPTIRGLLQSVCASTEAPAAPAANGVSNTFRDQTSCALRGTVNADSSTNSLIITSVASRLDDIVGYTKQLDVRTPQVAIKAKIIFVNRTDIEELGLSYDLGTSTQFFSKLVQRNELTGVNPVDSDGDGVPDRFIPETSPVEGDRIDLGGRVFSALANANNRVVSPALNLVYSAAIGKYSLTAFLDALQETRLADLQAEPTIVTLDNRRAEILVGEEIPLRILDANSGGGGGGPNGGVPRATVTLKEAGIILSVTPHITNNRQVLMSIHAENSSAEPAASDVGYIFSKQRADNQLLVGDGETAVIGGLTVTQVAKQKIGIPVLMNLPIIGRLFSTTKSNEAKRDLLILVTPHIIDEGERADAPGNGR